jgi:hypothetical protein
MVDLRAMLPLLLPKAIAWAETEANAAAITGQRLTESQQALARSVGVARPQLIRLALVDELPLPADPQLQSAAEQTGLVASHMAGVTLGYSVIVRRGYDKWRLLSHEFRHVYQYEQAGSIAVFLPTYLQQIVEVGYANAPLELDARAHEKHISS